MIDIRRTVIWVILLGAGGLLVGCDQSPLVPFPQASWDEIRYHEFGPDGTTDLALQRSGQVQFASKDAATEKERSGVLSDETIQDLDEAVSAVQGAELADSQDPCEGGFEFFVSITKNGSVLTFSGNECTELSGGAGSLVERLRLFVAQIEERPARPVSFRPMGHGRAELSAGTMLVVSLDELAELLQQVSPNQPVVWPPVDFDKEMILGYVGKEELLDVRVGGLWRGEGQEDNGDEQIHLVVEESHGIGDCPPLKGHPYDFVKVPRFGGDFVIEKKVTETPCEFSL